MSEKAKWILPALGVLVAGMALYFFQPGNSAFAFYPVCHFHEWTGWHCPGCGSLRAFHQLTHGNVAAAIGLNPLVILIGPVLLLGWAWREYGERRGRSVPAWWDKPVWLWTLGSTVVIYTVLRNLPFASFSWMAP